MPKPTSFNTVEIIKSPPTIGLKVLQDNLEITAAGESSKTVTIPAGSTIYFISAVAVINPVVPTAADTNYNIDTAATATRNGYAAVLPFCFAGWGAGAMSNLYGCPDGVGGYGGIAATSTGVSSFTLDTPFKIENDLVITLKCYLSNAGYARAEVLVLYV